MCSPTDPNKCIEFQFGYKRISSRVNGSTALSGWLPRNDFHDTDEFSASDSNTVNIGSLEYEIQVRSVDENQKPDVTFESVDIVGNFDPTLDTYDIADHFGNTLDLSVVDTLTWNWTQAWKDTFEFDPDTGQGSLIKVFRWWVLATGHDHPWDPDGSGVKSWRYFIFTDFGGPDQQFRPLARAGETWVDGLSLDVLNDGFQITFRYADTDSATIDAIFAGLPDYFGQDLTVILVGRDTEVDEPSFDQFVFLNGVKELVNSFPTASFGRYTREVMYTFHFRMVR